MRLLQHVLPISAVALCVAYQLLNKADEVGRLLTELLVGGVDGEVLLGLQLCFDMVDSGDEAFVRFWQEQGREAYEQFRTSPAKAGERPARAGEASDAGRGPDTDDAPKS